MLYTVHNPRKGRNASGIQLQDAHPKPLSISFLFLGQ